MNWIFTTIIGMGLLLGASAIPFNLARPDVMHELPHELLEISALTDVDENTVACVQDEMATVYLVDLRSGRITQRLPFGPAGDMEGLTRVGKEYFALRSDGLMFRMTMEDDALQVKDSFRLQLPNRNLEGLGYDERSGHILISPKDFLKGDPAMRDKRVIHAYDPRTGILLPEPVISISVAGILAQAQKAGIPVPMRSSDKGEMPALKLRFSSIAVDQRSDLFYLLSAVDRTLLVLDRRSKLVALEILDPKLFPKPEGITFLPSGDMIISNEGKNSRPNLLHFKRKGDR